MRWRILFKILFGIAVLVLLTELTVLIFGGVYAKKRLETALNANYPGYEIGINSIHISLLPSSINLGRISFSLRDLKQDSVEQKGEIESVKLRGIGFIKALIKKEICIREVVISGITGTAKIQFPEKQSQPKVAPLNIKIGKIQFVALNVSIANTLNSQSYSMKDCNMNMYKLMINKNDTLSIKMLGKIDFKAGMLSMVTPDSMYSFLVNDIQYSENSKSLIIKNFSIHPDYSGYDFTSRYKFQTDRIEAEFSNISITGFSADEYFNSKNIICSYAEIGKMNIDIFRDKRKEFHHINKPEVQDLIYNYPGTLDIDSAEIINGNVKYAQHAENANEPGSIRINDISANIYRITNDSAFRKEVGYTVLKADGFIESKGKINIEYKYKIFEPNNQFSLTGVIKNMDLQEINPILEKTAFISIASGNIDGIKFSFNADSKKAAGEMAMLYHGLEVALINKKTDHTTALKERIISYIINKKVMDSNPLPGEEVRTGIIEFERDPEKFIFNYWFKSLLSGIKGTLTQKKKNKV